MSLKEHIIVFTDTYILGIFYIFKVNFYFVGKFATIFLPNIFEPEVSLQFTFLKSDILEKMDLSPPSTIVKSSE